MRDLLKENNETFIFDEIVPIISERRANSSTGAMCYSIWAKFLNRVDTAPNRDKNASLIIGMTNCYGDTDDATLRRFQIRPFFDLPSPEARHNRISMYVYLKRGTDDEMNSQKLQELIKCTAKDG